MDLMTKDEAEKTNGLVTDGVVSDAPCDDGEIVRTDDGGDAQLIGVRVVAAGAEEPPAKLAGVMETAQPANDEEGIMEAAKIANSQEGTMDTAQPANGQEGTMETAKLANCQAGTMDTAKLLLANGLEGTIGTAKLANRLEGARETAKLANGQAGTMETAQPAGLMPEEQLCSDDSDTAGYYQMAAAATSSSDQSGSALRDSAAPSYQRGVLSSTDDDDSSDDTDADETLPELLTATSTDSDDSDDEPAAHGLEMDMEKVKVRYPVFSQVQSREHGNFGRQRQYTGYCQRLTANLSFVRKLRVTDCLAYHEGCINALNFNPSGTWLVSGSDDTKVVIWDIKTRKPYMNFFSGHTSNVFQTKFMPYSNDSQVVTCARDGRVRLAELSVTGSCRSTKKIAQHTGAVHKLATENDSAHCVLSAGEDSIVYQIDLREKRPTKLVSVLRARHSRMPLYSIDKHPHSAHEFIVSGKDKCVRVFDKRKISGDTEDHGVLKKFYPHRFDVTNYMMRDVTCAVYNYNGSEVLATYNDDDIYLFDNTCSDGEDCIRNYAGHRNSATVKGVQFFGPQSEYVVSGSDCGNVFLWDKDSTQLVQIQKGDEGVVNVLEPHPHFPFLAVSGLAHDVKLLMPVGKYPTDMSKFHRLIKRNKKNRRLDTFLISAAVDRNFYLSAMRMQRRRRARGRNEDEDDEDDMDTDSDDGGDYGRNIQCATS